MSRPKPFLVLLAGGLGLRLVLAYIVFPRAGYAGDLGLFSHWAQTLASVGPGDFYATASSADYPVGYLYVLWLLGSVSNALGGILGVDGAAVLADLLKLPAIAADVAIAALLYRAGRRCFGDRTGLVAAGLYLFVPVTWYDSALWGQVDAIGALVMLAAVLFLIEGWSEPAAALAVVALLIKPQYAICLAVVVPILVARHLLRPGSGPRPALGRVGRRANRWLGGVFERQGIERLGTSGLAAAATVIALLLPFDIERFAPQSLADVPVIGDLAGLVGLFVTAGGEFSVLTANAFNAWALLGPNPLAASIGASGAAWTPDSIIIIGGIPAVAIGATTLVAIALLVSGGLLVRDGPLPILLGLTVLAFAFYAAPTRVHERYLVPFFAPAALLAALALERVVAYLVVGVLNAVNLHAVLSGSLAIGGGGGRAGGFGGSFGGGLGGGVGRGGFGSRFTSLQLPLADLARSEPVVTLVAIGQSIALVGLVGAWIVVLVRGSRPAPGTAADPGLSLIRPA